ncbi:MAG: methylmalonyl-CoA mutase [Acidobacteriota bacterium]
MARTTRGADATTRTGSPAPGGKKRWEENTLRPALEKNPERLAHFTTVSDFPVERLVTPEDLPGFDPAVQLGMPGEYPFARGVHPTMYRGKLWTMRQFSGFGTARQTNERYRYLLGQGQTGLSVAFDLPTLMGRDSDDPMALGEVGREGVAIDSLADMERLFDGIPLDKISTSMTINAPAAILLAMYIVVAEKQGVEARRLNGTLQNDILKEYIAQKEWIYPPRPSLRIITDIMAFCAENVPRWNTISISGYHIREAGSTAVQELAFTLADGIGYVQAGLEAGMNVDVFSPRLSFFFNSHNDFFEEICKLRAARRIWARTMRERFHAKDPRSWKLRTHVQTAGCSLTAQQPYNNIVRVTIQALAAVLGGTQSLHTNSMDETLALPTQKAVTIALRTQQIIAEESGVPATIDPLGGSSFMEDLTNKMEAAALDYIRRIDEMGGIVEAIESGFPQREIAEAAYHYQTQVDSREKTIVGVNRLETDPEEDEKIPTLKIDTAVERDQVTGLRALRAARDENRHRLSLEALEKAAAGQSNLMHCIIEAVKAYATVGEISACMKKVFGEYTERPVL